MSIKPHLFFLALLTVLVQAAALPADDAPKATAKPDKADSSKENLSQTKHTLTLAGAKLEYEATAGTLPLKDEEGKTRAHMFFVAYTKAAVPDLTRRPVTFAFNGGPGSSAVWLQLGALGPKRVSLGGLNGSLVPPYRLVDNEATLLDLTDLVFIDPVSTGYSRAAPGEKAKEFHGVDEDIHSVGDFIRLYVTRFHRWDSPKFLAGESYGTTRAAGLVGYLQDQLGMNLNGIMLISSVLNFQTVRFDEGNDLPYILYLPSYTATAWYHKKLAPDLLADRHRTLAEAEKFAQGDYTLALMKGSLLSSDERRQVIQKLARYTGLTEDFVQRAHLRIDLSRFTKELLRDQRRTVGRYDSRFKGLDRDAVGDRTEYDPSYVAVLGSYTALWNRYVRNELKYDSDQPYRVLTSRVQPWDYGSAKNRYLNVAPILRSAMTQNHDLRVFVACGYYDLATPYLATQYTFNHLSLNGNLSDHITLEYYDAGHMMYIDRPSLQKLKGDLDGFLHSALRNGPAEKAVAGE